MIAFITLVFIIYYYYETEHLKKDKYFPINLCFLLYYIQLLRSLSIFLVGHLYLLPY